jgi:hypothetical protein
MKAESAGSRWILPGGPSSIATACFITQLEPILKLCRTMRAAVAAQVLDPAEG